MRILAFTIALSPLLRAAGPADGQEVLAYAGETSLIQADSDIKVALDQARTQAGKKTSSAFVSSLARPGGKACTPDRGVTWPGCEAGCCHYVLWELAANCFSPKPAAPWQTPPGCEGQLPELGKLCSEVMYQDASPMTVVINDSRMNKCPDRLVHTLAIPREQVCGDDDPDRFAYAADGFALAWKVGVKLIPERTRIVLIVHSREQRSQNQLHIHTARLKPGAREQIESLPVKPRHIDDLSQAWAELQRHADESGFGDLYGAVVIADMKAPGWLVAGVDGTSNRNLLTGQSQNAPDRKYACWDCDTCPE